MSFISYPPTNNFTQFIKALRRLTSPKVGLEDQDGVPSTGRDDGIASLYRRVTLFGTVKLHGSNITVVIEPSTVLSPQFQSRNRIITRETDHCDAVATLSRISWSILVDEILRICGTSTFREIFICGEWAGTGIQKGVAVSLLPRFFAIFNIRIDDQWVDMRKFATVHAPQERVYNVVNFQTFEVQVDFLEEANGERAYERMMQYTAEVVENCPIGIELLKSMEVPAKWLARQVTTGEGIVWTVVEPTTGPTLLNFKTKGEQFLATQSSKSVVSIEGDTIGPTGRARAFVDFALGESARTAAMSVLMKSR